MQAGRGGDKTDRTVGFVKGSKRRTAILASAASLFNRRGFAGTSIADVLEATSLEKGGLYNHFSSKEELALASFEYAWGEVNEHFRKALDGVERGEPYLHAYLDAFARYAYCPVVDGGSPLANVALEADDALPFLARRVRAAFRQMQSFARHHVERAVQLGHFAKDLDVDATADFIIAALEGGFLLARGAGSRASMQRIVATLHAYLSGLRVRA